MTNARTPADIIRSYMSIPGVVAYHVVDHDHDNLYFVRYGRPRVSMFIGDDAVYEGCWSPREFLHCLPYTRSHTRGFERPTVHHMALPDDWDYDSAYDTGLEMFSESVEDVSATILFHIAHNRLRPLYHDTIKLWIARYITDEG